ncbi:MAG: translation initiation factor IF-3 [Candidatus Colwellbacteria bacterium]|nr:translation initiation factor IF-3 [Candidatus Colwellbacteria bacterium]
MIGATGENLGVLMREKAFALAQEQGLDLILISESAKPPVARIIDFDKFRYEREKELKRQHRKRQLEGKQIQIGAKTAPHDLQIKLKKLEEFLTKGHRVEVQMVLRGRERANRDWARAKMQDFLKAISVPYRITREIKPGGRGLTVQIDPEKK